MSHRLLLSFAATAILLAACGKDEPAAPVAPVAAPAPAVVPELPPAQEVGDACSKDCGKGVKVEIQCAAGEVPVCDCAATPNASCQLPKPAAE